MQRKQSYWGRRYCFKWFLNSLVHGYSLTNGNHWFAGSVMISEIDAYRSSKKETLGLLMFIACIRTEWDLPNRTGNRSAHSLSAWPPLTTAYSKYRSTYHQFSPCRDLLIGILACWCRLSFLANYSKMCKMTAPRSKGHKTLSDGISNFSSLFLWLCESSGIAFDQCN